MVHSLRPGTKSYHSFTSLAQDMLKECLLPGPAEFSDYSNWAQSRLFILAIHTHFPPLLQYTQSPLHVFICILFKPEPFIVLSPELLYFLIPGLWNRSECGDCCFFFGGESNWQVIVCPSCGSSLIVFAIYKLTSLVLDMRSMQPQPC